MNRFSALMTKCESFALRPSIIDDNVIRMTDKELAQRSAVEDSRNVAKQPRRRLGDRKYVYIDEIHFDAL